jgi:hypothetical protein
MAPADSTTAIDTPLACSQAHGPVSASTSAVVCSAQKARGAEKALLIAKTKRRIPDPDTDTQSGVRVAQTSRMCQYQQLNTGPVPAAAKERRKKK